MSLYQRLEKNRNEFRLLSIKPGSPSSPIECTLEVLPLGDFSRHKEGTYDWSNHKAHEGNWKPLNNGKPIHWVPEFEALSYTWGDANVTEPIFVNGRAVRVTTNLKAALRALRKIKGTRVMWTDALCINQNDIQERNEQVPRMRDIYQRATRTIAWLGSPDPIALRAMDILETLGGTKAHMDSLQMPAPIRWSGPLYDVSYGIGIDVERWVFEEKLKHVRKQKLITLGELTSKDWMAIETFANDRPYWRRLWIIQEIVNSREVVFQVGDRIMGIETLEYFPTLRGGEEDNLQPSATKQSPRATGNKRFRQVIQVPLALLRPFKKDNLQASATKLSSQATAYNRFLQVMQVPLALLRQRTLARHHARAFGFENHASSLLNILEQFRGFNCTDLRDRVYALLGLPSIDQNMPLPKVDYSKSEADIFCETIKAIISHTGDLTMLSSPKDPRGMLHGLSQNIPTWVPDWITPYDEAQSVWSPEEIVGGISDVFGATGETLPEGPEFNFASTGSEPQKKIRPTMHKFTAMQKKTASLVNRATLHGNPQLLDLNGYIVDRVGTLSPRLPDSDFLNENWKHQIMKWEEMLKSFRVFGRFGTEIRELDPGIRHPKLGEFLLCIFGGKLFEGNGIDSTNLRETYVEHYLVWTQRIRPNEARVPILPAVLGIFFESELKKRVRGKRFAITQAQRLALLPDCADEKHLIAIVLGCDYPLMVQPICELSHDSEQRVAWSILGPAFIPEIMGGLALKAALSKNQEKMRFLFM